MAAAHRQDVRSKILPERDFMRAFDGSLRSVPLRAGPDRAAQITMPQFLPTGHASDPGREAEICNNLQLVVW